MKLCRWDSGRCVCLSLITNEVYSVHRSLSTTELHQICITWTSVHQLNMLAPYSMPHNHYIAGLGCQLGAGGCNYTLRGQRGVVLRGRLLLAVCGRAVTTGRVWQGQMWSHRLPGTAHTSSVLNRAFNCLACYWLYQPQPVSTWQVEMVWPDLLGLARDYQGGLVAASLSLA
jgi:hypothetical protein